MIHRLRRGIENEGRASGEFYKRIIESIKPSETNTVG